ncbi:MAG: ribonuclease [Cytophagales bacterium]|nr:MAG: ribonuclease [Cytophagales bacterium]
MHVSYIARFLHLPLLLLLLVVIGCRTETSERFDERKQSVRQGENTRKQKRGNEQYNKSFHKSHAKNRKAPSDAPNRDFGSSSATGRVPKKAFDVLAHVRQYDRAPEGYVGGRRFGNFEQHLPRQDTEGRRIEYREWDVNPRERGRNRGTERLVTGSDGRAWYTDDHYNSFIQLK